MPRDVRFEEREVPKIIKPTDAVIRLSATCICGSDLWPYRGIQPIAQPTPMGHEYCGIVEEVGKEVKKIKPGRFVFGSFATSDNSCAICQHGYQSSCVQREFMSTALQLTKRSHNLPTEWQARVESMNGHRGIGFLAMDCEKACGIVGSFLDQEDPTRAHLISMWTAPSHRQQGIGRLLVKEALEWARKRNAHTALLMVTSNNERALCFYERLGFARTGRTEQYPNDPAVLEYEMSRAIDE